MREWLAYRAHPSAISEKAICVSAWPIRCENLNQALEQIDGWTTAKSVASEDCRGSQEERCKKAVGKSLRRPRSSRPLMQGYGLPKSKKGLLPWKWAEQRLKQSHNYWITTVKPKGRATHHGGVGIVAGWSLPVQHRTPVPQGPEPG